MWSRMATGRSSSLCRRTADAADFAARVAADFAGRAYLAAHHLYRGDDMRRLARLAALGEATGLPLVATNDVLYHCPSGGLCRMC